MNNNPRAVRSSSEKQSHKSSAIGTRHSSIAPPNNNIHININLNVKKKSHCYHPQNPQGKKIQNYFELSDLKPDNPFPLEDNQPPKSTAVGKQKFLLTKPEAAKNNQKAKKKKTKEKEKTASKPFTPQKNFKAQSEEKSLQKSRTNKKLTKKKQSRSMENIKVLKQKPVHLQQPKNNFQQHKNPMQQARKINNYLNINKEKPKVKSRSNSSSKQRSRQKSGQKLKKMRSSSKNVVSFQNSGIKKVLGVEKQSGNKNEGLQNMRRSKKSLKVNKMAERDMIKINEFMDTKKKQEERKKREGEQSSKDIKIKDEILKMSKKEFYTKQEQPTVSHSISQYKKKSKFPMFYGQESDNNDEDNNTGHKNYSKRPRPEHKTPEKSRPLSKPASPQIHRKSSGKKPCHCLVAKYIQGNITKAEKKQLRDKVIVIQARWRGYCSRKNLMQEIAKMTKLTSHKKQLINQKRSEFWDDDENNSIINLDPHEKETGKQQLIPGLNPTNQKNTFKTPDNSNYNSSQTPSEQNPTNKKKYESESGPENEFFDNKSQSGLIKVNEFRKKMERLELKNERQKLRIAGESQNSSLLEDQIEMLKRQIQQQNRKFLELQLENSELRHNLKSIVVEKGKQKDQLVKIDRKNTFDLQSNSNTNSQPFSPIDIDEESPLINQLNPAHFMSEDPKSSKDPKQHQSKRPTQHQSKDLRPNQSQNSKQYQLKNPSQKFKNLHIQTQPQPLNQLSNSQLPSSSAAQSPSNSYVQNLKRQLESYESPSNRSLKSAQLSNLKGLQKAFKKKELSIDATYEKNAIMYQQMLQNNLVSPRTYSFKKVQLEQKYMKQKEEITQKYQEAEKVIKYISEQIVEQQKIGEDESPTKIKGQNQEDQIKPVEKDEFKNTSEKINSTLQVNLNSQQQPTKKALTKHQLQKQINRYNSETLTENNGNQSIQSNFRKYWTEDMDEVHRKVLEISSKIDDALESDSKYSESIRSDENKEYSSQNSNFQSLKSNYSDEAQLKPLTNLDPTGQEMTSPIFQETEYRISEPQQIKPPQQEDQVIANNSNLSSTSSGRNLDAYNIHYPSSPKSQKGESQSKLNFEIRPENFQEGDNSIEGNNSQLSQNRSSLSQSSLKSSTRASAARGFDTRLTFIKEYCIALCEFIRSQEELKQEFVANISTPLKYDYFKLLKSYRTTSADENDTKYNSTLEDYQYPYFKLVSGSLGERGLNTRNTQKFEELYEQNYNLTQEVLFFVLQLTPQMREFRKFFIQAIIDVFNQSLDFERPGSVYGEPLPWLVQSKNLKNNQVKFLNEPQPQKRQKNTHKLSIEQSDESAEDDERLDKIFGVAIAKIIQWGSCLCGFIPQPVSFDGEDAQAVNIDDQQTNLVRETRLAYMLEKSLAEDEEKMVDNTMEQLEVELEIQQMVVYDLITEFADEMLTLSRR